MFKNFKLNIQLFAEEPPEEIVDVPEENEVPEVKEEEIIDTPEEIVDIDFDKFDNLGTKEEVEEYLKDVLGDNPTAETKKAINKLLAKFNSDSKDEEVKETKDDEIVETTRNEVLNNLPIKSKEFNELTKWVASQPKEYQEQLEKETNYSTNSPDDIKKAILKAHNDRIKSVGGLANIDTQTGGYSQLTKDDVMEKFKTIHLTSKGQDRINKINELKKSAMSDVKLKEWAEIYFN